MKRFLHVCGDPGIPVPGTKGASIHVASVCQALGELGLSGEVLALRAKGDQVAGTPVRPLQVDPPPAHETAADREQRLFLSARLPELDGPAPDFVYERYSLWHVQGLRRARALGVPFVLEVNSPLPEEARRFRSLGHPALADGVAELLCRQADVVVAVSQEVAAWVARHRGRDRGVAVIPNGVDEQAFRPSTVRPPSLPPAPTPLLVFVGSFRPWHGVDLLVEALALVHQEGRVAPHLVLVGDGPTRGDVQADVKRHGLGDHVTFTGAVSHDQVPGWAAGADVAVVPYPDDPDFYFSPLKLYEFMAMGLATVATDTGQIRDVLGDGRRGVLVRPGDAEDLAAGLLRVLEDPVRARTLGAAARDWILAHATWKHRVREILDQVEACR